MFCFTQGLAVLLILLPLNAIVWTVMERYQSKQMKKKDERVRVITEILSGVKVLKLFSWEDSFITKISKSDYVYNSSLRHSVYWHVVVK